MSLLSVEIVNHLQRAVTALLRYPGIVMDKWPSLNMLNVVEMALLKICLHKERKRQTFVFLSPMHHDKGL